MPGPASLVDVEDDEIMYVALVTELEVQPLFTAMARIVSLALTMMAPP